MRGKRTHKSVTGRKSAKIEDALTEKFGESEDCEDVVVLGAASRRGAGLVQWSM